MTGIFAGLALVLAALGLYGVISYSIAQRMQEMGIRVALGARTADLQRMVIGRSLLLVTAGIVNEAEAHGMRDKAIAIIDRSVEFSEASPSPEISSILEGVYA